MDHAVMLICDVENSHPVPAIQPVEHLHILHGPSHEFRSLSRWQNKVMSVFVQDFVQFVARN